MKERFEKYINKVFRGVRETKEVKEIKEELISDLLSKSNDLKKKIRNEEKNYNYCIEHLGDLSELVKTYRKENNILEKKIELPKYKLSEELINSISHGIGAALSIVAFILCLIKSNSTGISPSTKAFTIANKSNTFWISPENRDDFINNYIDNFKNDVNDRINRYK